MLSKKENRIKNKEQRWSRIFFFLFSIFYSLSTNAQCAMCRAALTNEANKQKAEAVNDGIVYLMVIPYILVAAIGYYVYRMKKSPPQPSPKERGPKLD
jgi:heme/copper-type cytochrome/quinol oxidase subunit 2